MIVHIDEKLKEINKTRNWLSDHTGIAYKTMCKLCKNETCSISLEYIDRLCTALGCHVNDIFEDEVKHYNKKLADAQNILNSLSEEEKEILIQEMIRNRNGNL